MSRADALHDLAQEIARQVGRQLADPEFVDLIADAVAERVDGREPQPATPARGHDGGAWVDARWVAEHYSVKPEWVRRHKVELGYRPIAEGQRPRLRFSREQVERAMPELVAEEKPDPKSRAPRRRRAPRGVDLLPIHRGA
jgi:hypothetical protein